MTKKLDSPEFNKNEDQLGQLIAQMKYRTEKIHQSAGPKKLESHKAKGKLTARERIEYLIDNGSHFFEFGTFAAYEMYEEEGGCPAAGVITGIGYIHGKVFIIVANDAMVKAGAWFPMTGKKNLRAQEISMENHIPIIYLVDSAGVYLPMQAEIFPDKEHFGRIFRNNAKMSSMGITQIAAVMGPCVAGGAYLPIMSDESLIVDKTGSIFLAGPYLVKAAIGEEVDVETLGGADTQTRISGIIDYKCENDHICLEKIRSIAEKLPIKSANSLQRLEAQYPSRKAEEILGIYPAQGMKPYNMLDVLSTIVDEGSIVEYKPEYGKTIICTYANIAGWVVGIVANQRLITKNGQGEMQVGGVIYSDSADKAARFIMLCNQKRIPLIFFHDVSGFMVGTRSEHGGIIKDGAKMVNAVANSTVPKISIIVGNSYGAGNYAMCGKAYDPRFIVAWPTAKIAVMGGAQAAKVLLQIEVGNRKTSATEADEASELELLEKIKSRYEAQSTPYYAAARLWVDEIIDPRSTRNWISEALNVANHAPIEPFNPGVIQT